MNAGTKFKNSSDTSFTHFVVYSGLINQQLNAVCPTQIPRLSCMNPGWQLIFTGSGIKINKGFEIRDQTLRPKCGISREKNIPRYDPENLVRFVWLFGCLGGRNRSNSVEEITLQVLSLDSRSRRSAKTTIAAPGTPGDFRRSPRSVYKIADIWHFRYRRLNSPAFAKCTRSRKSSQPIRLGDFIT